MRTKIIMTALLSATLAAAPAAAARTASAAQPGQEAAQAGSADKADRKICKRLENSGTRLSNDRVCLTREQWKKMEDND